MIQGNRATGLIDEAATIGNILTIHGYGLKIEGDERTKDDIGVYFHALTSPQTVKAAAIAVNEPRTLKVIVPALTAGSSYTLRVATQSSSKHSGSLLKEVREMRSDFAIPAQN